MEWRQYFLFLLWANLALHLVKKFVNCSKIIPSCSCTNPIEDATHYFLECPLYTDQRVNLIADISQITEVGVDVILHGKEELPFENNIKIFQAVHEFITTSERFST